MLHRKMLLRSKGGPMLAIAIVFVVTTFALTLLHAYDG